MFSFQPYHWLRGDYYCIHTTFPGLNLDNYAHESLFIFCSAFTEASQTKEIHGKQSARLDSTDKDSDFDLNIQDLASRFSYKMFEHDCPDTRCLGFPIRMCYIFLYLRLLSLFHMKRHCRNILIIIIHQCKVRAFCLCLCSTRTTWQQHIDWFPTRMVYLYYISCLRYTILVPNLDIY